MISWLTCCGFSAAFSLRLRLLTLFAQRHLFRYAAFQW